MATTTFLVFEPLAPGDVVATLAEAEPDDEAIDDEGVPEGEVADELVFMGIERSAFWEHNNRITLYERKKLNALSRLVVAAEKQATNTEPRRDTCSARVDMSNLAFTVVARMNTLATYLMDRHDVTFDLVLQKLLDPSTGVLVNEIEALLAVDDPAAVRALDLLHRALDAQTFRKNAPNDLFGELNRRAAWLLAAKCEVAGLEGTAADWPERAASEAPVTSAAPPARRRQAKN
ncbi:hypothetical protein LRS03_24560 [Rhizobacter sp. J219]|uniref:hypothetical protein n=1 Tax=Rhizobacter sp. J219 TaxID=2898430 RepID=UPI002150AD32|nr:hypothetical protein [Rhizobacter sp. J219]MCR5885857.1 hypothetical protein [Rhizobacter sp. J219]